MIESIQHESRQLAKAKTQLVMKDPFYATIVLTMRTVWVNEIPGNPGYTLAATDGTRLYLHPERFEALTLPEAVGLLKHEAMHVAHLHPWRRQTRVPRRWNIACDLVINPMIKEGGGQLPAGGLDGTRFKGMSAEEVYLKLAEESESEGGGAGDEDGDGLGDDLMDNPDQSEAAKAQARANVNKAINVAKMQGKLPAGIENDLDDVLNPKVNWREQLQRFAQEVVKTDYSFAKANRRMSGLGYYLPGLRSDLMLRKIVVGIDTSGSMGDKELQQAFGELYGILTENNPSSVVIIYCDCQINAVEEYESPTVDDIRPKRVGGGGTHLPLITQYVEEHLPDASCCVILTDGYTDWPAGDCIVPTIWAITTNVVAPVDETVHVDFSV